MAEDDIYGSKGKFEDLKSRIGLLTKPYQLSENQIRAISEAKLNRTSLKGIKDYPGRPWKYHIKNPDNLKHFYRMFEVFDSKDTSYPRRLRLIRTLLLTCFATEKELSICDRTDIGRIVAFMHTAYKTVKSKSDFIRDIKYIWKIILPEKDSQNRADETVFPYVVRHLSPRMDKSKEKLRGDRLTLDDFERIVAYFSKEPCLQAFLTLSLESLGRPQEMLYIRMMDVEMYDNHAKIWISQHGKEGTGFLQCIDSHPYVSKWYNEHPFRKDRYAYFFLNQNGEQLKPAGINKSIRQALKKLNIFTPITCYSLKRNGVTFRRIRGDSDMSIQHAARWTSTKQLKTYDKSTQEDAFKLELIKKGIIKPDKDTPNAITRNLTSKKCLFCGTNCGFTDATCRNCLRPLDREAIRKQEEAREYQLKNVTKEYNDLKTQLKANSKAIEQIQSFMSHEAIQKLFKTVIKLKKTEN